MDGAESLVRTPVVNGVEVCFANPAKEARSGVVSIVGELPL
jgi:hypothetical protein